MATLPRLSLIADAEPLPHHPRHPRGGRGIQIGEYHQIVAAAQGTLDNRIHSARAAGDSYSCRRSIRNAILAQRLEEFEQIFSPQYEQVRLDLILERTDR
jgi:hypothetical protein